MSHFKAPAFLGKLGIGSSKKKQAEKAVQDASRELEHQIQRSLAVLTRQCLHGQSPALFRTFGGSVSLIAEMLVNGQHSKSDSIASSLHAATQFLSAGQDPDHRLEFALTAHTDQGALRQFAGHMESTILAIFHSSGLESGSLEDALTQWRCDLKVFRERCQEAWELHFYFVFLDLKGDRDMLFAVAAQLQGRLETSAAGVAANLRHTRPWVEAAFQTLSERGAIQVLRQRHKEALQLWLSQAKASAETAPQNGDFWDAVFPNVFKVSWPDFAEGFSETFCKGCCPQDILERLRKRVAAGCQHHVASFAWDNLMQRYGKVTCLLGSLTEEVLNDLDGNIYVDSANLPVLSPNLPSVKTATARTSTSSPSVQNTEVPEPRKEQKAPMANGYPETPKHVGQQGSLSSAPPFSPNSGANLGPHAQVADSVTPHDPRMRTGPTEPGRTMDWSSYAEQLCLQNRPWWAAPDEPLEALLAETAMGEDGQEPLRVLAIRAVKGNVQATRRALILRVRSGDLAQHKPVLIMPGDSPPQGGRDNQQQAALPALVITPNDRNLNFGCVTKFGRGSMRRVMVPDMVMTEPIASRAHFNIVFDPQKQKYQLMDAGSKWGTFLKIGSKGQPMSCSDWLHIGNVELVVRYCGGSCKAHMRHADRRQQAISLARPTFSKSCPWAGEKRFSALPWQREFGDCLSDRLDRDPDASQAADEEDADIREQAADLIAGRPFQSCEAPSHKMRHQTVSAGDKTRINIPKIKTETGTKPPVELPVGPLELDFISGPRMGERVLVTDRVCTFGRCNTCTVQVSDPTLPNVSRKHCFFEQEGSGWVVKDNKSTNGTWQRLSCILEPSMPVDLRTGVSLMAGIHELKVEEAELPRWWIPSTASSLLDYLAK